MRGLPELVDPRPQPSIDVRHEALTCYLRPLIVAIGLTRRQRNLDGVQILVGNARQQMCDAIKPGLFLVVGVYHVPRAHLSVGLGEHKVLCLRIIDPMPAGFYVYRAKLPAFDGVAHAVLEAFFLLLVIH